MNPTHDPDDDDLRSLLRALGRAGERRAPAFQRVWRAVNEARLGAAPPPWRLAWAAAAAVAVVLCAVVMVPRRPAPVASVPVRAAPAPGDDPLPTDFLLTIHNGDPVDRLSGEIDALLRP